MAPLDSVEPTSVFSTCQGWAAVWLRTRQPRGQGPQQLFPTKLSAFPDRFFPGFSSVATSFQGSVQSLSHVWLFLGVERFISVARPGSGTWINQDSYYVPQRDKQSVWQHRGDKPQAGGPIYDSIQSLNPDSEGNQVLQGLYMPNLSLSHRLLYSLPVRGQPSLSLVAWWGRQCEEGGSSQTRRRSPGVGGGGPASPFTSGAEQGFEDDSKSLTRSCLNSKARWHPNCDGQPLISGGSVVEILFQLGCWHQRCPLETHRVSSLFFPH